MQPERHLVKQGDRCYPSQLLDLEEEPRLFLLGDPEVLLTPMISIVGARRATPYGLAVAEMAARISAECGLTVVSGGARGCDRAASRAALDAGGRTVIVSGPGADRFYPAESTDIFHEAPLRGGARVPLGGRAVARRRYQGPTRNRIIAALSRGTFVAEASLRSGTMSTAETAMELGRTLYAVPGSIFSPTSGGTNRLISEGARIVSDERDLEQAISSDYGVLRFIPEEVRGPEGALVSALFASPLRPQELAERMNEDVLQILRALSEFEVLGMVEKLPDGRYTPTKEAFLAHNRGGA